MSQTQFHENTTALEVIQALKPDLISFEIIVTGSSSGIGIETVRALASAGARCIIAARDLVKAKSVADDIIASTGNNQIEIEKLELDSLESVDQFVKRYLAKKRPLHILINNAGVMACPLSYTKDGFEMQFGTNHIGHFALTVGLIPALKAAAQFSGRKSRVVNLSSLGHCISDVDFNDINFKTRPYHEYISYGQSKTANILFSVELTKRYQNKGIVSNAVMPGGIMTNLGRHLTDAQIEESKQKFRFKTIEAGASTSVWAAIAPEFADRGGLYLENCTVSKLAQNPEEIYAAQFGYLSYAVNEENAEKLWVLSEQLIEEHSKNCSTAF